jgi:hypothetical protein
LHTSERRRNGRGEREEAMRQGTHVVDTLEILLPDPSIGRRDGIPNREPLDGAGERPEEITAGTRVRHIYIQLSV